MCYWTTTTTCRPTSSSPKLSAAMSAWLSPWISTPVPSWPWTGAYNDYELFGKWTDRGVFFVTRLKDNAAYEVVASAEAPLPRNIRADEIIGFTGAPASKNFPHAMRRVVVLGLENPLEIAFVT